jgi:hypothetical protein
VSRYIEDEIEKPQLAKTIARWVLFALMILCVVLIVNGLYMMKQGVQLGGIWRLISGSFFFLIFYATQWLIRN